MTAPVSADHSTLVLTRVEGAPADWYPDPVTPGYYRYWDGHNWTDLSRPSIPYAAAAYAPSYPVAQSANLPAGAVAYAERKSPGLAFLLVLLFGPFGWLYISPWAGLLAVGGGMLLWHYLGLLALGIYPFLWVASWVFAPIAAATGNSRARGRR